MYDATFFHYVSTAIHEDILQQAAPRYRVQEDPAAQPACPNPQLSALRIGAVPLAGCAHAAVERTLSWRSPSGDGAGLADGHPSPRKEHTMDPSFGQYLTMDYQRKLRRAEARERLSLEEQAARGLLDDHPVPVRLGRRRGHIRLQKAWAWAFAYVWGPA